MNIHISLRPQWLASFRHRCHKPADSTYIAYGITEMEEAESERIIQQVTRIRSLTLISAKLVELEFSMSDYDRSNVFPSFGTSGAFPLSLAAGSRLRTPIIHRQTF